mmetsp:Transcript_15625/g.23080  ORF Transcript_15625/g.23080 Transcript_15625/m.23080 type:complete len:219 (+) Transcript_15625:1-657(+)
MTKNETSIHNLEDAPPPSLSLTDTSRKENELIDSIVSKDIASSFDVMDLANKGEQHTSPDRQSLTTSNSDRSPQWKSPSFVSRIMKSRSRSTDGMLESTPTNDSKRKVTISDDPAEVLGPASPERQYTDAENPSIQSPPMTSSLGYGDDLFEDEMTPEGMRWQMEDEELNYHPSRSDLRATPTKEEAGMERASPREDRFNGEEPYANHYPTPGKKKCE